MKQSNFFGRKVVAATFVMAVFGWGIGFYGPPIFLYTVIQRTGWSLPLCSAAVTLHFLAGTLVVVNLPALYKRLGLPCTTVLGSILLGVGVYGWSVAHQPYQLFIAALLSGFGWVTMGAAAVNALIAPWFVAKRPAALAMAYNGASIGGVIFSSAWVYLIERIGFTQAALGVGLVSIATITVLSIKVFRVRPEDLGQYADGANQPPDQPTVSPGSSATSLWRNRRFVTLATAMSLGLFAQIGLITHLFLLLVDHVTQAEAGLAMGLATASAIAGRFLVGWLMPPDANRRNVACLSYGCQLLGCLVLTGLSTFPDLLWLGVILFGAGIGNATSLPPLIAQAEFPRQQTQRVVTLIVATAQGCYAFAPAFFGAVKSLAGGPHGELLLLGLAAGIQGLAILALVVGNEGSAQRLPELSRPSDK
ncbi:MFS transporter [Pseudomonas batumici]|uniref:Putative Transporter n=1 Tax=Pseudomonas batumici TaxID=226910 RepID=A0A0C2IA05_9PSED|nr:MFS transporter [Pseudomonas batumici]KIH83785.1 putative Transporter [Pseudomonas batumici]